MNADEGHQIELEQRQRDEELWARHRELVREFGRECRDYLNHLLNRKGTDHEHRPERDEL